MEKQMTINYFNGQQGYEQYKRLQAVAPKQYPHDFNFYSDTTQQRHLRYIKEIKSLQSSIKGNKVSPTALLYNTWNSFYPSYILHHHYTVFSKIYPTEHQQIGAYFTEIFTTSKHPIMQLPHIDKNNKVVMHPQHYFYSSLTSPYVDYCCFRAVRDNKEVLCVVKVKGNCTTRDFGATVSTEYLLLGYNFNNSSVLCLAPPTSAETIPITEAYLSLRDLHKSLHITLAYTSMRRQFKTIDDSQEERIIANYQAVATRIINGFALFVALSQLYVANPQAFKPSVHHLILKELILLRQCCGGFGYLQVSGHPGCLERVTFRMAMARNLHQESIMCMPYSESQQRKAHPYSHPKEVKQFYSKIYNKDTPMYLVDAFCAFVSLCSVEGESAVLQAGIQTLYNVQELSRYAPDNMRRKLLEYIIVKYVWENAHRLTICEDKKKYCRELREHRDKLFVELAKHMKKMQHTLEVGYLPNVIVGRENSQQFYQQVVKTSKESNRNSKEFSEYVKKPVAEMIQKYRAKL